MDKETWTDLIENGISVSQYQAVMGLIRELIDRVEEEHRAKLEQLSSIQNEQRSALQMSMSESNQLKPGQLISTPSKSNSEFDQMFNGLGLGSYVSSKETAGSLATQENNQQNSMASNPAQPKQHLTLADKQKLLRQSETASKMAKQPQLQPNLGGMNSNSKPMGSMSKDLSSTLNSNLNQFQIQPQMPPQPNRSQSFNNFAQPPIQQQPQQPQWRPVWNQQPPSQQNQQIKPDLSAFDSLLSTSSSSNSKNIPMNSLMGSNSGSLLSSANNSNSMLGFSSQQHPNSQNSQRQQNSNVVKSLTSSDISDLLS